MSIVTTLVARLFPASVRGSKPIELEPDEGPSHGSGPDQERGEHREGQYRITVVLRPNTFNELDAATERDGCSLSEVVERILHNQLVGDDFERA